MYDQITRYIKVFAAFLLFLLLVIIGRTIQIEVEHRRSMERIGLALNSEATVLAIADAIPNQFEIGSSREDVMEKIYDIYPEIEVDNYCHGFEICNSGGCFDYIAFYKEVFGLELGFRFVFDDLDNLTAVEYAPGS